MQIFHCLNKIRGDFGENFAPGIIPGAFLKFIL